MPDVNWYSCAQQRLQLLWPGEGTGRMRDHGENGSSARVNILEMPGANIIQTSRLSSKAILELVDDPRAVGVMPLHP